MTRHETWLPVKRFEDAYEISDRCRIRSISRTITRRDGRPYRHQGRILRPRTHRGGKWQSVILSDRGQPTTAYVHVLMREAFNDKGSDHATC